MLLQEPTTAAVARSKAVSSLRLELVLVDLDPSNSEHNKPESQERTRGTSEPKDAQTAEPN